MTATARHRANEPSRALRVCIDARLPDGVAGGVQQTLIGLASGLSGVAEDGEDYLFLAFRDSSGWLEPYLGRRCELLPCERPPQGRGWLGSARRSLPALDRAAFEIAARLPMRVPRSNGLAESARVDVVHLALQQGFRTSLPTLYVPHDLQHRHMPELFSRFELRRRKALYPDLCRRATKVVALSQWGKRDLVEQLGVDEAKIHVVGWAPVLEAYSTPSVEELQTLKARYDLPDAFALYPAQTYRHKNHVRLLEAIALLRDRHDIDVPLVCCGRPGDFSDAVGREVLRLHLERSTRFVGFVRPEEIRGLYATARLLVFPSLFEGFGMPVAEAFRAGVPVACSMVTSLPEVAGDAALGFDPRRTDEIATAIGRLWTDPALRAELSRRGRQRVAGWSWAGVARTYRALYRLAAGKPLLEEDRELLDHTR